MIRPVYEEELSECADIIRRSFRTVADEFGITAENAPGFTAFATTIERLEQQYREERPMLAYVDEEGRILGYYSLGMEAGGSCGLNNLCVLPEHRHGKIGERLLESALTCAAAHGYGKLQAGIVEENVRLRKWYEKRGFVHTGKRKFDFFPFICGYLEHPLQFAFYDVEFMTDGEILLMLDKKVEGNREQAWLPSYHYTICDKAGHKMGACDLRVGYSRRLYFGGHIGYRVEEPYQGHHYAGKACLLLFRLAKRHGMDYLIITCNPENMPSRKTCEYAGGALQKIVDLPEDNDMRLEGETRKCIYEFSI